MPVRPVRPELRLLRAADALRPLLHIGVEVDGLAVAVSEYEEGFHGRKDRAEQHHPDIGKRRVPAEKGDVEEDERDQLHETEYEFDDAEHVQERLQLLRNAFKDGGIPDDVARIVQHALDDIGTARNQVRLPADDEHAAERIDQLHDHRDDTEMLHLHAAETQFARKFAEKEGARKGNESAPGEFGLPLLFRHDEQADRLERIDDGVKPAGNGERRPDGQHVQPRILHGGVAECKDRFQK